MNADRAKGADGPYNGGRIAAPSILGRSDIAVDLASSRRKRAGGAAVDERHGRAGWMVEEVAHRGRIDITVTRRTAGVSVTAGA